jgi:hypothetical protein
MADTTKKLKITGAAAENYMKGTKTRKRAPRGVPMRGGDETVVAPVVAPVVVPLVVPVVAAANAPVNVPANAPVNTAANALTLPQVQEAGSKSVKVILDPSKKKAKKIVLSPPKAVVKLAPGPSGVAGAKKTHKVSRRIRVSVDGLNKRVNRAKTIKKESQKMPIEQLKKELEGAALIKKGSTAPEHILRQMYSDFQVLKQRAL